MPDKYLGREIVSSIEFSTKGTFNAYRDACSFLVQAGYQYGSTSVGDPMGFVKGIWDMPWKWRNMTPKERSLVDGVLIGDIREGPIKLIFFD
jgi:hypothetical protein